MGRFSIEACFSVVFRGLVVQTGSEGERSRNGSVVCLTAGRAISRQCAYSCALGSEREMGGGLDGRLRGTQSTGGLSSCAELGRVSGCGLQCDTLSSQAKPGVWVYCSTLQMRVLRPYLVPSRDSVCRV